MCDINKICIHLCKMNIDINKIDGNAFISDIYSEVDNNYDLIITNPPIRAGKEILYKFINDGVNHLNKNGELWFVIHKDQGVKSIKKELDLTQNVTIVKKSKGFWIFLVKK